ncbi:Diphthamide synthesis [Dacryopinax primogenitus]|uniref:2-(3-amino-3-carboxypropyl)histidine synthase subunit 1 n=1 Tax=Dacryopinax primogenitus (strain DJM 731) TaxID=1858805 RepID=M5GGA5_DACPD|nr:Diphthamide synthesis [Dacryopinax primogenitus]EJU05148.1 Diphthamide synthesis [Dacryopinax primogenitus]
MASASTHPVPRPKKRFIGRKAGTGRPISSTSSVVISSGIPVSILEDKSLNAAIAQLPSNYSFEIHKTIWQIRKNEAKMVALQMPEGLQMFACLISDIVERFTDALTVIMGDVTYGACCIDDYTALALGCDMLVHYGHSCLVPVDTTTIKTLYVFVEIGIDNSHLARTVRLNFPDDRAEFRRKLRDIEAAEVRGTLTAGDPITPAMQHLAITVDGEEDGRETHPAKDPTRLAIVSTIQFVAAAQALKEDLTTPLEPPKEDQTNERPAQEQAVVQRSEQQLHAGVYDITIPRAKPLSPGEILGCTSPLLPDVDALIYVGDGRFHLESIMISNPSVPAFRYDPYAKKLTRERYGHSEMRAMRGRAVDAAQKSLSWEDPDGDISNTVSTVEKEPVGWGLVLGTLGRQGNLQMLKALERQLSALSPSHRPDITPILLSELSPQKLALFPQLSAFVQTSCPRLSMDWGEAFPRPLLSPYECSVAVGGLRRWGDGAKGGEEGYRMDYYKGDAPWARSRATGSFEKD